MAKQTTVVNKASDQNSAGEIAAQQLRGCRAVANLEAADAEASRYCAKIEALAEDLRKRIASVTDPIQRTIMDEVADMIAAEAINLLDAIGEQAKVVDARCVDRASWEATGKTQAAEFIAQTEEETRQTAAVGQQTWPVAKQDADATHAPNQYDLEESLVRAAALTALAQWIERARRLTESIDVACRIDKALLQCLQELDIAYADAERNDAESEGLRYLDITVEGHIEDVKSAVPRLPQ